MAGLALAWGMAPHELAGAPAAEFYDWHMLMTMYDILEERAEKMEDSRRG